jgi:hypothetical protein
MYFLEIMQDPAHPEHKEMVEWFGRVYTPDDFNPNDVKFDDPTARWLLSIGTDPLTGETG